MADERLAELRRLGQSPWLDTISRGMLISGEMQELIDAGLTGVTANPSIFEKAITGSHDYDDAIATFVQKGGNANDLYEELAVADVGRAADMFRPVYDAVGGVDGFVSLEVSPRLAYDTQGTIAEARRFWQRLDRPNVFIKVPATREGLPAIQQLIAEGINVNVTLLFGLPRYRQVADAYLTGLEQRVEQGLPLDTVHSVASFFLSRIDTLLDPVFEKLMEGDDQRSYIARSVLGEIAIASAKVAYDIYREIAGSQRYAALKAKGAHPQRLLWASTGTKNPEYPDLKYVDPLIGPETVNTMPLETLAALRDHGAPALTLMDKVLEERSYLDRLDELGVSLDQATQQLEDEGVQKFSKALDGLLGALQKRVSGSPQQVGSAGGE